MALLNRVAILAAVLASSLDGAAVAQAAPSEYDVKAVFLFNFAQFVDWPAEAFADASSPLVIGVLGEDVFGGALDEAVAGEVVKGRALAVRRYGSVEEVDACHVLFVSPSETGRLRRIMPELAGRSILTVGESPDFARRGGIVTFLIAESRVRLRINLEAAQDAGLTLSSRLLRLAEIAGPDS